MSSSDAKADTIDVLNTANKAAAEIKIRLGLKNAKNAAATEKARKRC